MKIHRKTCQGVLLLSTGSKVAITKIAAQSTRSRGIVLHASDHSPNVPTRHFADTFTLFDTQDRTQWIDDILDYCTKHSIGLVIPTRHDDLPHLVAAKERFAAAGIGLSLSSAQTIRICTQKLDTFKFLKNNDIPTPETTIKKELKTHSLASAFPLFAKPPAGASGAGATIVRNKSELESIPNDWILQSVATGQEYTVNIYLDRQGTPLCSIPHARLCVESGEVAQARTKRIPKLIAECERICRALPQAQGILNIQAFYDLHDNTFQVIEINPRIGGGFPLAHQAKGTYIEWLCQEWLDHKQVEPFERWTESLLMMRYRDAIFEL